MARFAFVARRFLFDFFVLMDTQKIVSIIDSLLFVSGDPLKISRLSGFLNVPEARVEEALDELDALYKGEGRGLALLRKDGEALLATNPDHAATVARFLESEREGTLSRAALETLSIIAYRGPIGRAGIEAIRGVNSSITLRNLLMRGLVERHGNPDDARGFLYSASFAFLETLGLRSGSELPEYEILSRDERLLAIAPEEIEGNL